MFCIFRFHVPWRFGIQVSCSLAFRKIKWSETRMGLQMRNWVYSQWKVSCAILPICTIIKNIYQILWCSISTIIYKCSTIAYIYQTHLSQMDNLNSSYCQKTNDAHRIKTIPQKITWHSHTPLFVRSKWKPAKPCVSSGWKSASCSWDASLLEWKGNTKKKYDLSTKLYPP